MARLEDGRGRVEFAEGVEEVVGEGLVERERGWKLDEQWAELGDGTRVQAGGLIEEGLEESAGVGELGFMGDGAGHLYGEAEVIRRGGGPAFPGFTQVRAVEAGVDLDAVEAVSVALEVGEVGVSGRGKRVGVLFGEGPAGGADMDVIECGRVG